jgi:hypothetical protein
MDKSTAESGNLRLIAGGLFWDPAGNAIYKHSSGGYVLYSRDRRKAEKDRRKKKAPSPTGTERRKQKRRG